MTALSILIAAALIGLFVGAFVSVIAAVILSGTVSQRDDDGQV